MEPISPRDRIEILDVLRGFAILGILLVNMSYFSSPAFYLEDAGLQQWTTLQDRAVHAFIADFAEGKFVALFSFLFGVGFALQMERTKLEGSSFIRFYARRLLVLLLIGLIHGFFIWMGDILASYAVLGLILLLFRRMNLRTVLLISGVLFLIAPIRWEISLARQLPHERGKVSFRNGAAISGDEAARHRVESSTSAYRSDSWRRITVQRKNDYLYSLIHTQALTIFPFFLVGLWAGRARAFQNLSLHMPWLRRSFLFALVIGMGGTLTLQFLSSGWLPAWTKLLRPVVYLLAHPAMISVYPAAIILLCQRSSWRHRLSFLGSVGRMALSNYLLQSVICTWIFYGYGLGLYGKVGPAAAFGLTLAIFALQAVLSVQWMKRFRYGPVEWIWRSFTYGKVQAMWI